MTAAGAPAERGFTLIEILVAVTLLGLLMAALLGGVRLGVRAWEASGTRLDDSARLAAVQDFLRDRLTAAYELEGQSGGAQTQPAFVGEPDRLSFVTLMPEHLGAGFDHMVLALTDGPDLAVTWWPSQPGEDTATQNAATQNTATPNAAIPNAAAGDTAAARDAVHSRVLLAHVAELQFAYFGEVQPKQPPVWSDVWNQPLLPLLVRVRLRFPDRDARSWPDLIVRPMIDAQVF
jgi:general secretion pathway protein J